MEIRQGSRDDDDVLIEHYMALWDSYGTPAEQYSPDARAAVATFLDTGRRQFALATFLASIEGQTVGSSSAQIYTPPYPAVISATYRRPGYIWHVFVIPEFQHRGVGRALTEAAIAYLRDMQCTSVVLNASDAGAPLYRSIGFTAGTEMRIKF